jgi:exodeoxyribonuclease VII small subunit
MPKERFEDSLNKLEKIVSKLEESLKLFEEGIRLSRLCNQKLDEAEKKVEILLKGKNGVLKPHSFDTSINSGKTPLDDTGKER